MDPLHPWLDHYPDGVDWHAPIPAAPLHRLMQDTGARFGPHPAFDLLGRRTTWAEAAMAARIAAGFQRLGFAKGDRVGLLLPNCPAYPLLFFGALQAGLTVVNFNPLYTVRELEAQARDAEIRAIATLDLAATYPKAAALAATRALMRGEPGALLAQMDRESAAFAEALRGAEAREAFTAFLERRAPNFSAAAE